MIRTANLLQLTLQALTRGVRPKVFGDDHPTPDGTCIRDYIHVADLADAHLAAVDGLLDRDGLADYYNVGTGEGASVLDVITAAQEITGIHHPYEVVAGRAIDPPEVVADPARIRAELDWKAQYGLDEMIESAWAAYQRTPAAATA